MKKFLLINIFALVTISVTLGQYVFKIDNIDNATTSTLDISGTVEAGTQYVAANSFHILYATDALFSDQTSIAFSPSLSVGATNTTFTTTLSGLDAGTPYYIKLQGAFIGPPTYIPVTQFTNDFGPISTSNIDQASNIVFSAITSTSVTASWTGGGGGNRIVFVKESSAVDYSPVDGTEYNLNSSFGSSTSYNGNYAVFSASTNSVNITGLSAGKTYHVKVFEYTGTYTDPAFRTDGHDEVTNNPNNFTTTGAPILTVSSSSGISTTGVTLTGNISSDGNATITQRGFFYSATNTDPEENGTDVTKITEGGVATGTFSSIIANLIPNKTYYYKSFAKNSEGTGYESSPQSFTTLQLTQVSNIVFSAATSTSVTATWTSGNGDNRILFAKEGSAVDYNPINGTVYSSNQAFGTSTSYGSGNYAIFNGASNSITVTGLTAGKTYHFKAFEYHSTGSSSEFRLDGHVNESNPNSIMTIKGEPTVQAHTIAFSALTSESLTTSWTRGDDTNNDGVLVLMSEGSAVTGLPSDGQEYSVDDIIGGDIVVSNGTSTSVALIDLNPETEYHFRAYEYNNSGSNADYLLSSATATDNPNYTTTLLGTPTGQATEISFTTYGQTNLTLEWKRGGGENCIVVARESDKTAINPSDGTEYNASSAFGNTDVDKITGTDNHVVYKGTGTTVNVTALSLNTEYTFKVYEYNNTSTETFYIIADGTTDNPNTTSTLKIAPIVHSSAVTIGTATSSSLPVSWTIPGSGGGDNRICLINTSNTFSPPSDGTDYSINDVIGSATVAYDGSSNSFTATGLSSGTVYYFKVYEYNNTGDYTLYYKTASTENEGNGTTIGDATWTGNANTTNWETIENWSTGHVPTSIENAIIPNTTFLPVISSSTGTVENMTIKTGATLTCDGGNLTIGSNLTVEEGSALLIENNETITVSGNATFESPTGNGASGQLVIKGGGTFTAGSSTYERYAANNNVFISAPSAGAFFSNFLGYYGDRFDETLTTNDGWSPLTTGDVMGIMEGWFIQRKNEETRHFSINGTFNNGSKSKSLSLSNNSAAIDGWHILGNPYPCAIDFSDATNFALSGVDEVIYFYNNGSYNSYSRTLGGSSAIIPAMQGFWMHTNTDGGTVTLDNGCRVNNSKSFTKTANYSEIPSLKLQVSNTQLEGNTAFVSFREDFTDYYESGEAFFKEGTKPAIYTKTVDEYELTNNAFSLESFNAIGTTPLIIPVGIFIPSEDTLFIEAIEINNIPENINIYLYDVYYNNYYNLRNESVRVELSNSAKEYFQLILSNDLLNVNELSLNPDIKFFINNNQLQVKSEYFLNNKGFIFVTDILGRSIYSKAIYPDETQNISLPKHGAYIVKVVMEKYSMSEKIMYNK